MTTTDSVAVYSSLTTDIQLCLAHYCDLHGPTPLMVTEGFLVHCPRCCDEHLVDMGRPRSSATSPAAITSPGPLTAVNDSLQKMNLGAARSSSATTPEQDAKTHRAALLRASKIATNPTETAVPNASATQTPPQSPRKAGDGFPDNRANGNGARRDSSFRRTYDEDVTKRANPCVNCSLTLPKRQDVDRAATSKTGKPTDPKLEIQGPVLRTRAPYARVYGSPADTSPPRSNPQSLYPSDAEEESTPPNGASRASSQRRPATSTSQSSATSRGNMPHHTHYIDYTSTREPTMASTYTIVRASCLRTLSLETLPRRPEASQSPTSSLGGCVPPPLPSISSVGPGFITAPPTPQSAANGGPIFFGDPSAGYTTAYIFRIPDMHARGRKRVYAFLALSTHRERLAMKAFSFISAAFRDLSAWIQELVEAEAEREREGEEGSAVAALNAAYGNGGFGARGPHDSGVGLGGGGGGLSGRSIENSKDRDRDATSSFLTGGNRAIYRQRMGGSMGPSGFTPKARGLAELVGLPDFFIELHSRFVKLLLELGIVLGS